MILLPVRLRLAGIQGGNGQAEVGVPVKISASGKAISDIPRLSAIELLQEGVVPVELGGLDPLPELLLRESVLFLQLVLDILAAAPGDIMVARHEDEPSRLQLQDLGHGTKEAGRHVELLGLPRFGKVAGHDGEVQVRWKAEAFSLLEQGVGEGTAEGVRLLSREAAERAEMEVREVEQLDGVSRHGAKGSVRVQGTPQELIARMPLDGRPLLRQPGTLRRNPAASGGDTLASGRDAGRVTDERHQ
jgi:hypothetical protein